MKFFQKLLFPVDLSQTSPKLVPYAITMARKFDAELHLLFVARDFAYFTSIYVPHPSIDNFVKEILAGAEKKLSEFNEEYLDGVPNVKLAVESGDPSLKILDYIDKQGIDLVVIGTHGRKGMEKVIFGSVAERVISKSKVPVLVVNPYHAS